MDEARQLQWENRQSMERDAGQPLLRVCLFGTFQLHWHVPALTPESAWDSRTSARALFKLLLCAPERQAPKSILAGILWPETDEEKALESLRSAVKVLRKVLCTADGEVLIEQKSNGSLLKLAEQSRLWVDTDAFEASVAQASRAATADEALPLWQQARTLVRGEFLAEDQQYEWVSYRWVKQRRQTLWMARSRMIRHLADLSIQRGDVALAEEELEHHIARFPTDQDALYRLLTLLEQQECFEQASMLYARTKHILEATGKQPAKHVRAVYERIQHAIASLHQAPLARSVERVQQQEIGEQRQTSQLLTRTNGMSNVTMQLFRKNTTPPVSNASFPAKETEPFDIVMPMLQTLSEREEMPEMAHIARRQLLELGIASCISRLAQLDSKHISAVEREELGRALGQSIADGWKLFHSLEMAQVLAIGRAQLSLLHHVHAFIHSSALPYLYTGVHGLIGIGLHFQAYDEEALQTYHNGYIAALATHDPWYIAQNLICQADTYLTLGRQAEALRVLEEALNHLSDIDEEHRRAKAHILACQADTYMVGGKHTDAHKKLDEAVVYLDKMTSIEEFDYACWLQLAGKNALMTHNYAQAATILEEALEATPAQWLARRVGIFIPLAMAYARMKERERSLAIAQQAIPVIGTVNASMTNQYFLDYMRNDLLGRFPGDTEVHTFLQGVLNQLPQLGSIINV